MRLIDPRRRSGVATVLTGLGLAFGVSACCEKPNNSPVGFTIAIDKPVAAVAPGGTVAVTGTVTRLNGFTGSITVHIEPSSNLVTPSSPVVLAPNQTAVSMTVAVSASFAAPESKSIAMRAEAPDYESAGDVTLLTIAAAGTFNFQESAHAADVFPGATAHAVFNVIRNNYTQPVTVSFAQLAPFSTTVSPGATTTNNTVDNAMVFDIVVPDGTAAGTYTIPLTATGAGSAPVHADLSFKVKKPGYSLSVAGPSGAVVAGSVTPITVTATRDPGFTAPINLTATSSNGITITPATINTAPATMQVTVPGSVTTGSYNVRITAVAAGQGDIAVDVALPVAAAAGYTLAAQTSPLNIALGTTAQQIVSITRNGFAGDVTINSSADQGTSTAPDPGITITSAPPFTSGNSTTLNLAVGNGVSIGTHLATVTGSATGLVNVTTTFNIFTSFLTNGTQAPAGIVITTPASQLSGATAIGSTRQYTAYLVDAQGNRTLPAAGFNIGFAVTNSNFGTLQTLPAYDANQRWRIGTVQAGPLAGATTVTAFYFNTTTGASTFTASAPLVSQ